ncbi:MAG: alpha/beta hydrolase [Gemmatimonadetes bacterium]|jgi:pimeloyl-ACP methyl ester carboxylesterase|nr:alpha/beta hydrolase [Gemmatimonadota bacterium]
MNIPGFQTHTAIIDRQNSEELEVVYLDNGGEADAPCLLLLHGLFDNKATWTHLCRQLGNSCRIVAPDLIGFGRSSKPPLLGRPESERYAAAMHVEFLGKFIDCLGLDNYILVGNSLGGGIALQLYLTRSTQAEKIRGLILIAAAGYPQEIPGYIRQLAGSLGSLLQITPLRGLLARLGILEWLVRGSFHRTFFDPDNIPEALVEEAVAIIQLPDTVRSFQLAARNIVPPDHAALVGKFSQIDCPTLVLWGKQDRIIPSLFALRFQEDIPHTELHTFDACGHASHIEYTEESAALIDAWLQRHFQNS